MTKVIHGLDTRAQPKTRLTTGWNVVGFDSGRDGKGWHYSVLVQKADELCVCRYEEEIDRALLERSCACSLRNRKGSKD